VAWKEEIYPARDDPAGTRALIHKLCDDCLASVSFDYNKLVSIGVALPSPIDPIHPEVLSEEIIPAWEGESGLDQFRQRYGVPVYLDNDANLGALAEHWWGAGQGVDDLIYIKIAHGIGAGYILGGEIYRGAKGISGELSHMPIDPNGKYCGCGLRGCLTTFIAGWALEERATHLISVYPQSTLAAKRITILAIEDAALAGDALALQVVREAANYLSIALTGLINLMNPKMVILGGSLVRIGDLLLKPIRDKVQQCNLLASVTPAEIQTGELGPQTIAIGAATLALEKTFDEHHFFRQGAHAEIFNSYEDTV
jgi:predicted NBD/HSP70 family sugar kinase